jgi:hypothetical protein
MSAVFTVGELAGWGSFGDEVAARGTCDRSLAEIAARADVCRKLAQLTLRLAARQGLVSIQRRPRPGRKNLSNVVRIIGAEWTGFSRSRSTGFGKSESPALGKRGLLRWASEVCGDDLTSNIRRGRTPRGSGDLKKNRHPS